MMHRGAALLHGIVATFVLAGVGLGPRGADDDTPQSTVKELRRTRRPVALAPSTDGKWLYVANHRSGSISVIDVAGRQVAAEIDIGKSLADLVLGSDGRHLIAVDEAANELIRVSCCGPKLSAIERLSVANAPVTVQVTGDGSRCFVASLWSHCLTVVDLRGKLQIARTVDLPFAPRQQLCADDGKKVIVADSFGGKLALVDVERAVVESVRELPGHNVRGLALSATGSELLLAHQTLAALAQTTRDDIHWGNLLTNSVRLVPLREVLDPKADLVIHSRLIPLGEVGRGAGDPAGIATVGAETIVSLAGVDEVAIGRDGRWQRLGVESRPSAVAVSPDGKLAFVSNSLADSISILGLREPHVVATVSLGSNPPLSERDRGEALFYDARLSHDGWLSCHSCHTDGHANGQLNDNLGDGSFGAPKRVLSLLGVKDTGPWAWNGEITELESQIRKSLQSTMHGPKLSEEQENENVRALGTFLRSLAPPPSLTSEKSAVERGRQVFAQHGCSTCHAAPTYTTPKTYDVGLRDEVGRSRFNPPSLRGVAQGGPYFHDNRAGSLNEVFTTFGHQLKHALSPQDLSDLLAFILSLQ